MVKKDPRHVDEVLPLEGPSRSDVSEPELATSAGVQEPGRLLDEQRAPLLIVDASRGPQRKDAEPLLRRRRAGQCVSGDLVQHRAFDVTPRDPLARRYEDDA